MMAKDLARALDPVLIATDCGLTFRRYCGRIRTLVTLPTPKLSIGFQI